MKRSASPPPSALFLPNRPSLKPSDQSEGKNEIDNTTMDDSSKGLPASFDKPSPTMKLNQKDNLRVRKNKYAARVLVPDAADMVSANKHSNQKDDEEVRKNKYAERASVPGALDIVSATTQTTAEPHLEVPPKAQYTQSEGDDRKKLDDDSFLERPVVRPLVEAIRGIDASAVSRVGHESGLGSDDAALTPVVATAVNDDELEQAERLELEKLRRQVATVPLVHAESHREYKSMFWSWKCLLPLSLVLVGTIVGVSITAPYNDDLVQSTNSTDNSSTVLLPCEQRCKGVAGRPVNVTGNAFKRAILEYIRNSSTSPYGSIIACWDVSQVTDMSIAFASDLQDEGIDYESDLNDFIFSKFNEPLDCWDTSSVTNMNRMFLDTEFFISDLKSWNVSSVTDMAYMFSGAATFQAEIGSWDVSSVTDMTEMFLNAAAFNANISSWDVSRVETMSLMFLNAKNFNGDIGAWNVSKVTNMDRMFDEASSFNQNLCDWGDRVDVSRIITSEMFADSGCNVAADPSSNSWCQICAF